MCGVNITENKNSSYCIDINGCCWSWAQAFRPVILFSIGGDLQQIFQWLQALSVVCFHLRLGISTCHMTSFECLWHIHPNLRQIMIYPNMTSKPYMYHILNIAWTGTVFTVYYIYNQNITLFPHYVSLSSICFICWIWGGLTHIKSNT